jgi:signal transduction histidine kinase
LLARKYSSLSQDEKLRAQYFIIGGIIFAASNLLANVTFPLFQGNFKYYWIGDYSMIVWIALTAYAIVRRELFGIKVVLTEILVGAIAIILLIQIFVSQSTFEYIWKSGLLALFLFFGYLLIRSILGEINSRKKMEEMAFELSVANIKLAATYKSLEKVNKAKSEFISMASHQLRTPLSAVKGYISMLLEGSYGKVPPKIKEKMDNVFQSNERMIQLVNDLLNISRIELGKMELEKGKTSIEELIQSCYVEMKMTAERKGLNFIFEKPKFPLPEIMVDALKIRQVILNLIDNAIKYTKKGKVTISAEKDDSRILISVKDTGAGLTEKEQGVIFEGFTRGSAGITHFIEGTGLGLYIAKKYLELHRGKIWVESPGKEKGATFFVELPIETHD